MTKSDGFGNETLKDLINRLGTGIGNDHYNNGSNGGPGADGGNNDYCKIGSGQKWWISFFVALIFFIFANPISFAINNEITTALGGPRFCYKGGATWTGILVHTIVVFFFVRLILL